MPSFETVATAPTRADVWHTANAHCRVQFQLQGEAEPDLPCRVLNLFALQGLTLEAAQIQRHDDLLSMEVLLGGLSWHRAQVLAEKLRNLISICSVDVQDAEIALGGPVQAVG
ncbi:hypothetical protein HU762_05465 [Pseudomonas sp. SWRI92]|uniref:Uncharacterized protein n=1 Tax=Pseudomonas marvdashtae TaxID=2745500 RepID=A0A923FN16_9PSED|nr:MULTISPECIES: hypothetical protein [Pseudomonas]MBC3373388.1 hypothetical protein [Pseudomonas sp. SWRI92]MBV4549661.1 hypothetical protein [Pseudomonas marvdashtae]